jgi:hypothetical protein
MAGAQAHHITTAPTPQRSHMLPEAMTVTTKEAMDRLTKAVTTQTRKLTTTIGTGNTAHADTKKPEGELF